MSVVKSTVSTDQIGLGGKISSLPAIDGIARKGYFIFGLAPLPEVVFLDALQTPHGCNRAILS